MQRKMALKPNQALNVFAGDPLQNILKCLKPAEAAQLINSAKQIKLKASNIRPVVRENYLLVRRKLAAVLEITLDDLENEAKLSQARAILSVSQKHVSRFKCYTVTGLLLSFASGLLSVLIKSPFCGALALFLLLGPSFLCFEQFEQPKYAGINSRVQTVQHSVTAVSVFKRVLGNRAHQEQQPLLEPEEENNLDNRNDMI